MGNPKLKILSRAFRDTRLLSLRRIQMRVRTDVNELLVVAYIALVFVACGVVGWRYLL